MDLRQNTVSGAAFFSVSAFGGVFIAWLPCVIVRVITLTLTPTLPLTLTLTRSAQPKMTVVTVFDVDMVSTHILPTAAVRSGVVAGVLALNLRTMFLGGGRIFPKVPCG